MRIFVAVLGLLASAACTTDLNFTLPPSQWGEETSLHFSRQGRPIRCSILLNSLAAHPEDRAFILDELRKIGANEKDIEILTDPDHVYGTGMSFVGLECAARGPLARNTSFYPGIGHQWQVPFGPGFVYLRGDGTDAGMRVYAWN